MKTESDKHLTENQKLFNKFLFWGKLARLVSFAMGAATLFSLLLYFIEFDHFWYDTALAFFIQLWVYLTAYFYCRYKTLWYFTKDEFDAIEKQHEQK